MNLIFCVLIDSKKTFWWYLPWNGELIKMERQLKRIWSALFQFLKKESILLLSHRINFYVNQQMVLVLSLACTDSISERIMNVSIYIYLWCLGFWCFNSWVFYFMVVWKNMHSVWFCVCLCGAEANTHGSVKGKQALDTESNSQLYKWCFEFWIWNFFPGLAMCSLIFFCDAGNREDGAHWATLSWKEAVVCYDFQKIAYDI